MFFEQFESESIVALCQGAVPHHVSEHDGSEFPLLCVLGRHERTKAETPRNETANSPNGLAAFANPASVGQGGAVRRSATDTMWKRSATIPNFTNGSLAPNKSGSHKKAEMNSRSFFAELKRLEICPGPIKVMNKRTEITCHKIRRNRSVFYRRLSLNGLAH